jgi:hypothetical protein
MWKSRVCSGRVGAPYLREEQLRRVSIDEDMRRQHAFAAAVRAQTAEKRRGIDERVHGGHKHEPVAMDRQPRTSMT